MKNKNDKNILLAYTKRTVNAKESELLKRRILLDYLTQIYGKERCDYDFIFVRTEYGKPYVKWISGDTLRYPVHFSISHTKGYWVMAVSIKPIGVDIEYLSNRRYKNEQAVFFHHDEQHYLEENTLALTSIWSAKESYLKLRGTGIIKKTNFFSVIQEGGLAKKIENYDLVANYNWNQCCCYLCGQLVKYDIVSYD